MRIQQVHQLLKLVCCRNSSNSTRKIKLFSCEKEQDRVKSEMQQNGFAVCTNFVGVDLAEKMREEAVKLYENGHMFASVSLDDSGKEMQKKNVFATELDGNEWDLAPSLLDYTRKILINMPPLFNHFFPSLQISQKTYGTKLAVSLGEGSSYPKHCDNAGLPDIRKLTLVYYLNQCWEAKHGGELRLFTPNGIQEVQPLSDTLVLFWSDQVVHDVNTSFNKLNDKEAHRYALTLWLCTENPASQIVNPNHPLYEYRQQHFPATGDLDK